MLETVTFIYTRGVQALRDYANIWFEIAFIQLITRIAQFMFVWAFFNLGLPYGFSAGENQELVSNFDLLDAIDVERLVAVVIICSVGAVLFYSLEVLALIVIADSYYEGREIELWSTFKVIVSKIPRFFYSIVLQVAIYSFITFMYASVIFILLHILPWWFAIPVSIFPTIKYMQFVWTEFLRLTYVNYRIFDEHKTTFGLFDYLLSKEQLREIWVFSISIISLTTVITFIYNAGLSYLINQIVMRIASIEVVSISVSAIIFFGLLVSIIASSFITSFAIIYRSKIYHEIFNKPKLEYKSRKSAIKRFVYNKRFYAVGLLLIICTVSVAFQSRLLQKQVSTYLESDFITMAHRGGDGLDNTREAIQQSIDEQYDAIEIDVQLTKDNRLVLFHDEFILLEDQLISFSELRWDQLQDFRYANGRQLISLEEAIETAAEDIGLTIEFKIYNQLLREQTKQKFYEIVDTIPESVFLLITSLDDQFIQTVEDERSNLTTGLIITASLGEIDKVNTDWLIVNNLFYQANSSAFASTTKKIALWSFSEDWVGDYAFARGLDAAITDQPTQLKEFEDNFSDLPRDQRLLQAYIWSIEYTDLGLGIERF